MGLKLKLNLEDEYLAECLFIIFFFVESDIVHKFIVSDDYLECSPQASSDYREHAWFSSNDTTLELFIDNGLMLSVQILIYIQA